MKTRFLGRVDYQQTWQAMREFTDKRDEHSSDELWVCEHPPVYTLGQAGKLEHLLEDTIIPVVHTDRGGQITYHGPGQTIVYTLFNLKRAGFGIREMVVRLENSVIALLGEMDIAAHSRRDAPGVYVGEAKIAALGLRVRRGSTYHGIALNIDPDMQPFKGINPCGYQSLEVTCLRDLGAAIDKDRIAARFVYCIEQQLSGSVT